jgi:hypothetical protein
MRFGLIPIVTEATGLSVHDYWPALQGATDDELIADIVKRCTELSGRSDQDLKALSDWFWRFAQENHSREAFLDSLNTIFDELFGADGKGA